MKGDGVYAVCCPLELHPCLDKENLLGFNDQMSFASLEHTGCDARVYKQVA